MAYLDVLADAFPGRARYDSDCWIREAFESEYSWDPALMAAIHRAGVWDDVVRRLVAEHPSKRIHHPEHDNGVFGVATEARAAAWGYTSGLHGIQFVWEKGAPDWKFDGGWIEAKRIRASDLDRAHDSLVRAPIVRARIEHVRSVDPGFPNKLDSLLDDAVRKWVRQGREGALYVYVDISLDVGVLPSEARSVLASTAKSWVHRESGW